MGARNAYHIDASTMPDTMICFTQPKHPKSGQPTGVGHPFHLDIRCTVGDIKETVEEAVKHRAGAVRALNLDGVVGWDNNFWRDRSCWFYLIREENTLWENGEYYKGDDRYDPKTF